MYNLNKIAPATYEMPQEGNMLVPGLIIATESLLNDMKIDETLQQVRNVACLPGIVGHSIAMPDMHWGYGFPIGGVAAVDAETGVISPGGVGYDINCGVRLAIVPLSFQSLDARTKQQLIERIFHYVPSGVGKGHTHNHPLTDQDYAQIADKGVKWALDKGYALPQDLDHIESYGFIEGANIGKVSQEARDRGRAQLGTIGSGNHFAEIGEIETLFLPEVAAAWGIEKGQTYILIHSGSRGFGHQICQDTLNTLIQKEFHQGLPDRQLVAAPIKSREGRDYFAAMATAANYAFNNRQLILHAIRRAFTEVFAIKPENIRLIYDVCHNIAKFENHLVNGKMQKLCVHRKGATRSFGKGTEELSPVFRGTGQPVLVPGDMGRASHLMVGLGNQLTWSSSCHGAGRAASRHQSANAWKGINPIKHMKDLGVTVMSNSMKTVVEEMPNAYKNVDDVVDAVQEAKLANKVARLRPQLVLKG